MTAIFLKLQKTLRGMTAEHITTIIGGEGREELILNTVKEQMAPIIEAKIDKDKDLKGQEPRGIRVNRGGFQVSFSKMSAFESTECQPGDHDSGHSLQIECLLNLRRILADAGLFANVSLGANVKGDDGKITYMRWLSIYVNPAGSRRAGSVDPKTSEAIANNTKAIERLEGGMSRIEALLAKLAGEPATQLVAAP